MSRQFQYPLEPLRMTSEWHRDAMALDLQRSSERVDQEEQQLRQLDAAVKEAEQSCASGVGRTFTADAHALALRFVNVAHQRRGRQQQVLLQAERQREEVRAQALAAQRKLDAMDEHRDDLRRLHAAEQQRLDYQTVDDQWTMLTPWRKNHANAT